MTQADVQKLVAAEYARGVALYGDWSDYTLDQMMAVIINELMIEAAGAAAVGDMHGEHGVICELTQVSACCNKAVLVLLSRREGHLAETLRAEGAHSCLEGRALPASPSLHQGKETISNSPIGESHGTR